MGIGIDSLPIGSHVWLKLKSGASFTAILDERTEEGCAFIGDLSGMRISLGENDISELRQYNPRLQSTEMESSNELTGIIKVFKREYMWGVILASDGLDYQFSERNIADQSLSEWLKSSDEGRAYGIAVSFRPSTITKRNGDTKDIAVDVFQLRGSPRLADLNQHLKEGASVIPNEIKERIYQVLLREQRSVGHPLLLSQAAPLLKKEGIDQKRFGYSKAKPFFLSLGFVAIDKSGKNGAERVILERFESEYAASDKHELSETDVAGTAQMQETQSEDQKSTLSAPVEQSERKLSFWKKLFGEKPHAKEAKQDKAANTTAHYGIVTFEDEQSSQSDDIFDIRIDDAGFTPRIESLLIRGGYSTMTDLQKAMTEKPFAFMQAIGLDQAGLDEITEKVMLFMTLDAYMRTTEFSIAEAKKYLYAGKKPEPSFDYERGIVLVPSYEDEANDEPESELVPDEPESVVRSNSGDRIEGSMLFFAPNILYGQIEGDNTVKYKADRCGLDQELLVYLAGASPKEVHDTRVSFLPSTHRKTGDDIAIDIRPLVPIKNDPQLAIDKGHDALLHHKYQAANVLFWYAVDNGLGIEVGERLASFLPVCRQLPDTNKKPIRLFDKFIDFLPASCGTELISFYEDQLESETRNGQRLILLKNIINAEKSFAKYDDALVTCDRWKAESSEAKNKAKTAERALYVDLDKAVCLYHLGRIDEAKEIAEAVLAAIPDNQVVMQIIAETLEKPERPAGRTETHSETTETTRVRPQKSSLDISPKDALSQGQVALLEKRYEDAESLLLHAINNGYAQSAIGNYVTLCLQQEGRATDALSMLERYESSLPRDKYRNLRISVCDKLKDYTSLVQLYEEAYSAETSPQKKAYCVTRIIDCHVRLRNYDIALEACRRWETLYQQYKHGPAGERIAKAESSVELRKAICLYFIGKVDDATEIARRRVLKNPADEIANAISNGTLAVQLGVSDSIDDGPDEVLFEGSYFEEDLLDSLDGARVLQNAFISDFIRDFDSSSLLSERFVDGRYSGTIDEAKDDVRKLLRCSGNASRVFSQRVTACKIMTQFMSKAQSSETPLPWGDASISRTAARAMLYWADTHIQIGQQDSSRMAYLFVISNLRAMSRTRIPKKGWHNRPDETWHNACDNYLRSFYLGPALSSYIADRKKPLSLDGAMELFAERDIPDAIVPSFVIGILNLSDALANQPKEKDALENALFSKNGYLRESVISQLRFILDDNSLEATDVGSFSSALDKARRARTRKTQLLSESIASLCDKTQLSKTVIAAKDFIQSENWRVFCSETDVERIAVLYGVLIELTRFFDELDFEDKADSLRRAISNINELRREIGEAPTDLTYSSILPALGPMLNTLNALQAELYDENQPNLSWEIGVSPHVAQNGLYRVQLVVSNEEGCQAADSITLKLSKSAKSEIISIDECSRIPRLQGGAAFEVIMMVKITQEAIDAGSFTLPILFSYESRNTADGTPEVKTRYVELPAVILDEEFEPFENPYAAYGGGSPITNENDEMFFGRKTEKAKLVEMVHQGGRMNYGCAVAMYGQTRTGKSSLLGQVQAAIMRKYGKRIVLCDLGNIGSIQADKNDPDRFLAEFLYQVLIECSDSVADNELVSEFIDADTIEPSLEMLDKPSHAAPLFQKHMKKLDKALRKADAIVLLIIDEFTYLHSLIRTGRVTENFMRLWKAMLQDYCVFSIVVGQDDMPEFMDEYPNEFACMDTIKLTYLEEAAAKSLIHEPLERVSGRSDVFQKAAIDSIYTLTAGSAFLTMKLCSRLVDYLNDRRVRVVTKGILNAFIEERVFGANSFIEEKDFEPQLKERGHPEYDDDTKLLLHAIAKASLNSSGFVALKQIECEGLSRDIIEGLCERLVDRNVLLKIGGRYSIQVFLLTMWLLQTMGDE